MVRALVVMLGLAASGTPAIAGELVVNVTGITSGAGEVGCALHANAAQFLKGEANLAGRWQKANPGGVTCRFPGLPAGAYAVAVFHDLNGNRKLDTNAIGMPTEAWGVTNNVRPTFRAPSFDEAQVAVSGTSPAVVTVRLGR